MSSGELSEVVIIIPLAAKASYQELTSDYPRVEL